MEKKELKKYAGGEFYVLSTRMGGMFTTIHCLTLYKITERGTCRYQDEIMPCVANKAQYEILQTLTKGNYFCGRPHAGVLTERKVKKLIK
ncbi:MAG: hypothetical protein SV062_08245 [Thermodesulfobacteriota bacterium]|nr:hypothetical protein [Thermodesulfobacteriota bacterium]